MIDLFKTNGSSPPKHSRRYAWLGLAAVLGPWVAASPRAAGTPGAWTWAALMRRV